MSNISIKEEGKLYAKSEYFSGKQIFDHDYQDKLTNIFINSRCSLNWGERIRLADNIHNVRKIFSEHTDNNIKSVWVGVFDIGKLDTDEFKKREIKGGQEKHWKNSIHVKFGDVQDKVLVYSWLDINQFSQDQWNNFLLQLEGDQKVSFIGTGPLTFKYKDFNYLVYPPLFVSSDDEESFLNNPEVYNFSPTEVNKIIEDIKESHQSIEKKIINHYELLRKSFAENNKGYIEIKAGIGENNVKNFTDVSYTNGSDGIHNNPIEEAFIKEEELHKAGGVLHKAVYRNDESFLERLLGNPPYDVNEVNKNDRTPLHLAAKYGRKDMVEMLLNKEAKVDIADNRGRTPLHLAAQYNEKKEIVEMLLNKGAKVDIADSRGRTPLHLAAVNGHKEVVEALIKAKANVNIKDEDEKTAFNLAADDKIKTLLQPAEKTDPVDKSSTDSKGNQEEDADTEKKEGDAKPESDTTKPETVSSVPPSTEPKVPTQNSGSSVDPSNARGGIYQKTRIVDPPDKASTEETEEQPSSFFGSLFSILTKPFSLIASFFSGFFSWLFGSDEPTQSLSLSESAQPVMLESSNDSGDNDIV